MRLLVDTAVFVYARGNAHHYRDPCRRILTAAAAGSVVLEASAELVQEFAHLLRRRGLPGADVRAEALDAADTCVLHPVDADDVRAALGLLVAHPALQVRDAVHAATALRRGIGTVVSPDRAFGDVPGLERLDPVVLADRLG